MNAWWRRRTDRERRIVGIAGASLAAAIVGMLWLQAERSRARLAQELPRLRASIASLERDAGEVRRLRALPAKAAAAGTPLASLATNAGGVPGAEITVIDARRVRLAGSDVGFGAVLEWLGNAQATHGMRVESARLEALPAPGRVKVEIILARS